MNDFSFPAIRLLHKNSVGFCLCIHASIKSKLAYRLYLQFAYDFWFNFLNFILWILHFTSVIFPEQIYNFPHAWYSDKNHPVEEQWFNYQEKKLLPEKRQKVNHVKQGQTARETAICRSQTDNRKKTKRLTGKETKGQTNNNMHRV